MASQKSDLPFNFKRLVPQFLSTYVPVQSQPEK